MQESLHLPGTPLAGAVEALGLAGIRIIAEFLRPLFERNIIHGSGIEMDRLQDPADRGRLTLEPLPLGEVRGHLLTLAGKDALEVIRAEVPGIIDAGKVGTLDDPRCLHLDIEPEREGLEILRHFRFSLLRVIRLRLPFFYRNHEAKNHKDDRNIGH